MTVTGNDRTSSAKGSNVPPLARSKRAWCLWQVRMPFLTVPRSSGKPMWGHRLSTAAKVSSLAKTAMVCPDPVTTVHPRFRISSTVPCAQKSIGTLDHAAPPCDAKKSSNRPFPISNIVHPLIRYDLRSKGSTTMKITNVRAFATAPPGVNRNYVFVKVETDEGIEGWGEATMGAVSGYGCDRGVGRDTCGA